MTRALNSLNLNLIRFFVGVLRLCAGIITDTREEKEEKTGQNEMYHFNPTIETCTLYSVHEYHCERASRG